MSAFEQAPQGGDVGRRPQPDASSYRAASHEIVRGKNPAVDLKLKYARVFRLNVAIVFLLHVGVAVAVPKFDVKPAAERRTQTVIQIDDIPETRQIQRPPPPPRPAVPIATESEDVPDDITIESTDLDFDDMPLDLPPPPPPGSVGQELEEEIVEFWAVEEAPELLKEVVPDYPELARRAGLEGTVIVQFVVGKDGRVRSVLVLKGPEIFRQSAVTAVSQFVFKPALQNDRPVDVRMTRPIRFRFRDQ